MNKTNNNLLISILSSFIFLSTSPTVFAQIFNNNQSPLSVKWREIKAGGFQLIYPSELEAEAQRMATTLPAIYPQVGRSLQRQQTQLPIVFQNRLTMANGFVQLAPRKSEFYSTPPQSFDSQDWLNNLAVHELRHVAQFDKLTGNRKHPFPEEIFFAYIGLSVPTWFLEGDAVSIETALTSAGRGRQPSWIMPFRTSLLHQASISYSKAYFGSQKDLTPGYYQLGYLMTSLLRKEYGEESVNTLLQETFQKPLRFYPFSQSLKKLTGKNTRQWFKHTNKELKTLWDQQEKNSPGETYELLHKPSKIVTSYHLPTALADREVLTLKHSKNDPPAFVLIDSVGREKKLTRIAYQEQAWLSYGGEKIVWDEIRFDPRYKNRSYSVISSYDLSNGKRRQLTHKSRLYAPALSGDGQKLIAISIDLSNRSSLVELDPQTGQHLQSYPNPTNELLQTPALNYNGSEMAWISVDERGKSLWYRDKNGQTHELIPKTNQQLSRPVFTSQGIAFNAHLNGLNNIYEVNPHSKKIVALSASKYGAFNLSSSLNSSVLLFNDFGITGYNAVRATREERPIGENHFVYVGQSATEQEGDKSIFRNLPEKETHDSQPYRPLAHLFNFHSLSPYVEDEDISGLELRSHDLLNTLDTYGGISYNSQLRGLTYKAGITYKALFPMFSAVWQNRPRTTFYKPDSTVYQADWRENHLQFKAVIPLSLNAYNHTYSFIAEIGTTYTNRQLNTFDAKYIPNSVHFPMVYRLSLGHAVRSAERDVSNRFAQSLTLRYFHQPFDNRYVGKLAALESYFYFPGLLKNHGFIASLNFQKSSGIFRYSTEIPTVYGYQQLTNFQDKLNNTLLLNYRFPILFPDWEIGPLAYVKNIRGGVFSHYENLGKGSKIDQPKTYGFELKSHLHLLRYQPLIDVGGRMIFSNRQYNQSPVYEFTFSYSF